MTDYTLFDLTTCDSLNLLENFVLNLEEALNTFRYFTKRDLNIVKTHIVSFLVLENDMPVAYGHLEQYESIVWLGVCVLPNYQGRKLGLMVMNELISKAKKKKIHEIYLTVDRQNKAAINLYEQLGFTKIEVLNRYYKYKLLIN